MGKSSTSFEPNNDASLQHGGAAARRALSSNTEFTGPARDAELAVRGELAHNGRLSIVERAAVRLQAAADLYWHALCDAGERGDYKALSSYTKSFGWLQAKALSAWSQLRDESKNADDGSIEAAISSARGDNPPGGHEA